jgi:hypothetical protein
LLKYYPNGVLPTQPQCGNFTIQANILQKTDLIPRAVIFK